MNRESSRPDDSLVTIHKSVPAAEVYLLCDASVCTQHCISSCVGRRAAGALDTALVRGKITPFGVARTQQVTQFLADTGERRLGHAAESRDQAGRDAVRLRIGQVQRADGLAEPPACSQGWTAPGAARDAATARRPPLASRATASTETISATPRHPSRPGRAIRAAARCQAPSRRNRGTSSVHRR